MNQTEHSIGAPEVQMPVETRNIGDAIGILHRAINVTELLYMAGNHIWHDLNQNEGEAIMVGADMLDNILKDVRTILYANIQRGGVQ